MNNKKIKIYASSLQADELYHNQNYCESCALIVGTEDKGISKDWSQNSYKNVKIPPSLANIYKELQNEFPERNYTFPHGNLERWFTEEKIFLLNSSLTVAEGKPSIFMQKWNPFTDDVIKFIAENNEKCIFLLLGAFAKNKAQYIECKSRIVTGTHPSPLSAYRGFFNSNIFKKLDLELTINWNI